MQKYVSKQKTLWGFTTIVKVIVKSANHKQGYIKHLVNEVDVCETLLAFDFGYFCGIYLHFPCFYLIFDFCVWFTNLTSWSAMINLCSNYYDSNIQCQY